MPKGLNVETTHGLAPATITDIPVDCQQSLAWEQKNCDRRAGGAPL